MGSYLPSNGLSHFARPTEPQLYYHGGALQSNRRFEVSSVEGWILKQRGIAIMGPQPQDLPFTVDWDIVIKKMRDNLNSFWASYTKQPNRIIVLISDWGIQWTVLGVLRQFYSFRENSITTKTKAGEYALTCLPTCWHRLIREAINIREGKAVSAYRFRAVRAIEVVNFLKYVVQTCNAGFA